MYYSKETTEIFKSVIDMPGEEVKMKSYTMPT